MTLWYALKSFNVRYFNILLGFICLFFLSCTGGNNKSGSSSVRFVFPKPSGLNLLAPNQSDFLLSFAITGENNFSLERVLGPGEEAEVEVPKGQVSIKAFFCQSCPSRK